MQISPELVAVGLAHADRRTVAPLLALFTNADLPRLIKSQLQDLAEKVGSRRADVVETRNAFAAHLEVASEEIFDSLSTDEQLRLQLWMHIRDAFDLDPAITFSYAGLQDVCHGFEVRTSEVFEEQAYEQEVRDVPLFSKQYWTDYAPRV